MMETRAGFQLEVEKYLDICACGPVVEIGLVGDISRARGRVLQSEEALQDKLEDEHYEWHQ